MVGCKSGESDEVLNISAVETSSREAVGIAEPLSEEERASILVKDMCSTRRDEINLANLFLSQYGSPELTRRLETHADWYAYGAELFNWFESQAVGARSQMIAKYPVRRMIHSPIYPD
jgi:hypothetical protein